jgi:hypothetical protein
MAGNTKTLKNVIVNPKEAWVYLTLASDGTNETNYVVYDSSVVATAAGDTDPLTSAIIELYASASAAQTARVVLRWDATTPVLAMDIPAGTNPTKFCAGDLMCLPNQGGSGITGDITLTTTGLASGDAITILMRVKRQ